MRVVAVEAAIADPPATRTRSLNIECLGLAIATAVAMFTRGVMQHADYPGILTTAGNMAYPFSPFGIPVGPAYRFNVYHLMPVADPLECFPVRYEEIR